MIEAYFAISISFLLLLILFLIYKIFKMSRQIKDLKKQSEELVVPGYDKFVVESREWAFDYIEQVQTNLQELVEASEKIDQTVKKLLPNK